jgi:NADPH2:quinone reductase
MRAMSAAGFNGYEDLKLIDLPKPQVSEGKVLVRMTAAGATPLDHTILSGQYHGAKAPLKLPRFRGHRTVCVQGVHDGQDKIALRT